MKNNEPQPLSRVARSRLVRDRLAARVVGAGGVAIIAAILGIMIFLVAEVLPLLGGADGRVASMTVPGDLRAGYLDEYQAHTVGLFASPQPRVEVRRTSDGEVVAAADLPVAPRALRQARADAADGILACLTTDHRVVVATVEFAVDFVGADRRIRAQVAAPIEVAAGSAAAPAELWSVSRTAAGVLTIAVRSADGMLAVVQQSVERNELTEETSVVERRYPALATPPLSALSLDHAGANLYAAQRDGGLAWWRVAGEQLTPVQTAPRGDAPVTALHCLYGDVSLLVGTQAGGLEQWFPVRDRQQAPVLTKIRSFAALPAAVTGLAISTRSKAFAAVARDGSVATYFATTGQQRWQGTSGVTDPAGLTMTARGDALLVVGANAVSRVALADPHPEPTLLGVTVPVHYESYDVPVTKWESTPATDAAEPKLSITPLVFGTLKATFFCLLLAVPLAVLAALYVSQFVHPRVRAWVKPTVELMAALPSVVLGFVAAVWLAPLLEHGFPTLLLALLVVPFAIIAVGLAVGAVPERVRQRLPRGLEVIGLGTVIVAAYGLCALLAPWLDAHVFGHDFPGWVRDRLGLDYQQKNAVVVAIAMAFAVIPIVFSIAEDAFSNVPRSLISASLALGANRWQTAAQVVLPTASPGVFSATMIGFGRAIGETMIVLMAVGATAIMDWNPFNGFRSLSANIAIEIGEAEHGGTLYRLLFVTALLLFALTFAVNTLAEIVRARLRKRYATL